MSEHIFRVELTGDQMHVLKMALSDAARWYTEYAGDNEWMLRRAQENLELREYLDRQIPASPSTGTPPNQEK